MANLDGRPPLVAVSQQVAQQFALHLVEGHKAQLIDDQQSEVLEAAVLAFELSVVSRFYCADSG